VNPVLLLLGALGGLALARPGTAADPPFTLKDCDRVVFIGSTVIEREQRYGYWETALTIAFPDRNIQFRNLGWSGDTVWGEARAGFETAQEGYKRLIDMTLALKPTVLFVGYGTNESFAGKPGLMRFENQLNRLLDDLKPSKAKLVLMAPLLIEKEKWPAGNFEQRTRDLKLYTEAIRKAARNRQAEFMDDPGQRYGPAAPLTDDGMHLTAFGYCWTAHGFCKELHLTSRYDLVPVVLAGLKPKKTAQSVLPMPPYPIDSPQGNLQGDSFVNCSDLEPGKYTLRIDGRPVKTAGTEEWKKTDFRASLLLKGPSLDQAEKLRQTIVEKNRLFFNRWRPQNETYLFGFRKYEQGQNAREIPEFDPLIEQLEKEIARLRKPVPHTYQLVPAEEGKK
jgi:lysophospholipase L1-like esterase